jgi:hypothetical protein
MIALNLSGRSYQLRPSFAALLKLEQQSGVGLLTLARKFAASEFTLAELLALITTGLEGAGETLPPDLPEQLAQAGLASLTPVATSYLQLALTGEQPLGKA